MTLTNRKREKLRDEVRTCLELRLNALDDVVANRTADNIRYSMYCGEQLEDAITNYHDELQKHR